jgi:hypothetical protein
MRENLVQTQMDPFFHPRWRGFVPCRRNRGRDNGRKKRPWKRPFNEMLLTVWRIPQDTNEMLLNAVVLFGRVGMPFMFLMFCVLIVSFGMIGRNTFQSEE